MVRRLSMILAVSFLVGCANFPDSGASTQLYEQQLSGKHAALADCIAHQLQRDGRTVLRLLQIRNRQYPDIHTSEIHAYDTRYLRNAYAAYAPSNPDGILFFGEPLVEVLPLSQRNQSEQHRYAFALTLQQIDDKTVAASLKGESFEGKIAWQIVQRCVASSSNP